MAKMGRPKKEIDRKQFESLCAMQGTIHEICGVLDVSEKTLEKWCREEYGDTFSKVFAIKREVGKASLRRMQFRLAEKNAAMAIFLGKNYLNQRDHIEYTDTAALSRLDAILNNLKDTADEEADIQSETE